MRLTTLRIQSGWCDSMLRNRTSIRRRFGVLGFSAGGRLVAAISTNFAKRLYPVVDAADKESCRPDFGVALYPGHMLENTSKNFELNPYIPVTRQTPPTFLLQAEDDPIDTVKSSLVSECQTCKYMGIDFLDFLRLGRRTFAPSRTVAEGDGDGHKSPRRPSCRPTQRQTAA